MRVWIIGALLAVLWADPAWTQSEKDIKRCTGQVQPQRGFRQGLRELREIQKLSVGERFAACTRLIEADKLDDKDLAIIYFYRGYFLLRESQEAVAIKHFDKAISLYSEFVSAYYYRGRGYFRLGETTRAIADFNKTIELDSKFASAYFNRGNAYWKMGQTRIAIKDFDKVISLDPKYLNAYYNRGAAYAGLGLYQQAIQDYSEVIRLDPKNAAGYNAKAWVLATAPSSEYRDGIEAVKLAAEAVQLEDDVGYRDTFAAAYAETGQFKNAVREQERVIEMLKATGQTDNIAGFESRLDLYRQNKPYHQESN